MIAYFQYRVELFHRSVRDFLQNQWNLGIRKNPSLNNSDEIRAYSRLRCLEIEGLANQNLIPSTESPQRDSNLQQKLALKLVSIYESTFIWLAAYSRTNRPAPRSCLEESWCHVGPGRRHILAIPSGLDAYRQPDFVEVALPRRN